VPSLRPIAAAILHHHERYDGGGYPTGLVGEQIPLEARIVCVADAFSAMTADRPYRARMPLDDACEELERHAGTQFDPRSSACSSRRSASSRSPSTTHIATRSTTTSCRCTASPTSRSSARRPSR
jgi:hypothetical protein